jgi:hypothetical protein
MLPVKHLLGNISRVAADASVTFFAWKIAKKT